MHNLKEIERYAELVAREMNLLELGEEIGRIKTEIAIEQARLKGFQNALKLRLNKNPVISK